MRQPALSPTAALEYLEELSTDVRAAVLLSAAGDVAASSGCLDGRSDEMGELARAAFEQADRAAGGAGAAGQVEIVVPRGAIFAVRDERWTLAVVANRSALPSLMFYDLRSVISDLGEAS